MLGKGVCGTLNLGVDYPLPFVVQDDPDRLAFDLDTETAASFRSVPERLVTRRAA